MHDIAEWRAPADKILDAHRRGLRDRLQTLDLLESLHKRLAREDQNELCEHLGNLIRTEPLQSKTVQSKEVNLVCLAILAIACFGPTEHVMQFIFSRASWDDAGTLITWANEICPALRHALVQYSDRFDDRTLTSVRDLCPSIKISKQAFPLPFIEALQDLERLVDHIEFQRFERTLKKVESKQRMGGDDLYNLVQRLGLDPSIPDAMRRAASQLARADEFDEKIAADLIRSTVDVTHGAIVKKLALSKKKGYSGEDRDADRRNYMLEVGFITQAEKNFFACIYSLISQEASHKLVAPRETILVLQRTVNDYLVLLLTRLEKWIQGSPGGLWAQHLRRTMRQGPSEIFALVLPCGQGNLPDIGKFERVLNEFFPNGRLRCILRLRVAEERHVGQLHLLPGTLLPQRKL